MNTQDLLWQLTREILNQEFPIWARGQQYGFTAETNWSVTNGDHVGQYIVTWESVERDASRNYIWEYEIRVDVNVNSAMMLFTDPDGEELDALDISIYFR